MVLTIDGTCSQSIDLDTHYVTSLILSINADFSKSIEVEGCDLYSIIIRAQRLVIDLDHVIRVQVGSDDHFMDVEEEHHRAIEAQDTNEAIQYQVEHELERVQSVGNTTSYAKTIALAIRETTLVVYEASLIREQTAFAYKKKQVQELFESPHLLQELTIEIGTTWEDIVLEC